MQRSSSSTMFWPMSTRFGFLTLSSVKAAAFVAVLHGVFLQLALAGLVADGAVERVIDEEKFHHALAAFVDDGRVDADAHALGDLGGRSRSAGAASSRPRACRRRRGWACAGRRLGHAHLDQAHAAVARDGELGVVAVMRDELADAARDLDGVEALGELHPDAVDLHVEERCVGGRIVVVVRIFHGSGSVRRCVRRTPGRADPASNRESIRNRAWRPVLRAQAAARRRGPVGAWNCRCCWSRR